MKKSPFIYKAILGGTFEISPVYGYILRVSNSWAVYGISKFLNLPNLTHLLISRCLSLNLEDFEQVQTDSPAYHTTLCLKLGFLSFAQIGALQLFIY